MIGFVLVAMPFEWLWSPTEEVDAAAGAGAGTPGWPLNTMPEDGVSGAEDIAVTDDTREVSGICESLLEADPTDDGEGAIVGCEAVLLEGRAMTALPD